MSDDVNPNRETDNTTQSDTESTSDTSIDELLQRTDDTETDQPPVDTPNGSHDGPSADKPASEGRLWDSFSTDRSVEHDREKPSDGLGGGLASDTTTSRPESPSDGPPEMGDRTTRSDPNRPAERDGTDSGPNADSENGPEESRFKSILKRISHRISRAGSTNTDTTESTPTGSSPNDTASTGWNPSEPPAGSDPSETSPSPDPSGTSAGSDPSKTSSSPDLSGTSAGSDPSETSPNSDPSGPSTDQGTAAPPQSSQSQTDTIDQILNSIDVFGRATSSSQVLLLSPTAHSITNEVYDQFLLPTDGSGQNVVFVSATQTVDDQLGAVGRIPDWTEGRTAVIEVGQSELRSTQPNVGPDPTHQLDVYKSISNFQHLAKLGINISHIVSQWTDNRRPTVVGVHTLSSVQQYVGNETMFQFLFTLKGQLNSMGVMGFYHMDPSVHTDNEINTITSAFDLVIRVASDGTVDIE